MAAMSYPTIADELAWELRRQRPEPYGPHALPPALRKPRQPRVQLPTYEPSAEHAHRVRVRLGKRYVGDIIAFSSGYRAYLPDDTRVEGLYPDLGSATTALLARVKEG